METEILQQEVLLSTGTSFSQRQIVEIDNSNKSKLSDIEKLEDAVWTGLLDDLLPEIITNKKLSIWQVWNTEFTLQIELSRYPSREKWASINPNYFLRTVGYN